MQTFKAETLISPANTEIKLKEWKIKENSKLSLGSVIFTYEYQSDGKIKLEKFKSTLNGITVRRIFDIKTGDVITSDTTLFSYEKCSHPVKSKDMCAICGEDLRKREETNVQLVKKTTISSSASVKMLHQDPSLQISDEMALELGKKDLVNLVENRKLVLLVDLDHTLIHTTNEHVKADLKEVYHYELLQKNVWYHTKFRPGCIKFLEDMSKLYELHMVTFGERNYAHKIADLMDPGRKYFHDRILSRNEIFNPISKSDNLRALFPRGDLMVCIIDDREDVWDYASNLICVKPYVYFKNTGDINDPALFNKKLISAQKKRKLNDTTANNEDENSTSSMAELADLANEDFKTKTDKDSDEDKDDYLIYLEDILRKIHDEYYKIYESRLQTHKKTSHEEVNVDEADLPDVKKVLPLIKSRILENCVITFSGVVPTGYELKNQRCYRIATWLGAKVNESLVLADDESDLEGMEKRAGKHEYNYDDNDSSSNCSGGDTKSDDSGRVKFLVGNEENVDVVKKSKVRYTTHLVAAKYGTSKVHEALKSKIPIKVVTPEWLIDSNYKWIKSDEENYKLTKDYDYKNCLFHHEYNMHQKYSSNSSSSKNSHGLKSGRISKNESSNSLSSYQTKTKKAKSEYSEEVEEIVSSKDILNDEIFDLMDKEVNDELLDAMDSETDELEENGNGNGTETSSSSQGEESDEEKSKLKASSSSSSSSLNSGDDSIDDEFALELERNLSNRNQL